MNSGFFLPSFTIRFEAVFSFSKTKTNLFNQKNKVPLLDCIHKGVYSYKCHVLQSPKLLESARIVYFHGDYKPHELGKYEIDEQLMQHWI